jgi:hypothetical protein
MKQVVGKWPGRKGADGVADCRKKGKGEKEDSMIEIGPMSLPIL